ncbi:MAG: FAD:protein FMN transferase [Saprospiraceae bacterium]|nr:FAD:protein FMN transferase [Saprospiraceae bacterium]
MIYFALKVVKFNAVWLLIGCLTTSIDAQQLTRHQSAQPALGTLATLTWYATDQQNDEELAGAFFQELDRLNLIFSDYTTSSEVGKINASVRRKEHRLSSELCDLLHKANVLYDQTLVVDPYLGRLTHLWKASFKRNRLPSRSKVNRARKRSGTKWVERDQSTCTIKTTRRGLRIDLGGIAKGYIGDLLSDWLKKKGIERFLIDLGGDLTAGSAPPGEDGWRIAIGQGESIVLSNASVASSGSSYQHLVKGGVRYNHLIDPRSGWATSFDFTSTVIAAQGWLADACASALPMLTKEGRERLADRFGLRYQMQRSEEHERYPNHPDLRSK